MKTVNVFTTEDLELLKTPLPYNPCLTCGVGAACCGCPEGREHLEKVKRYKELNIYDIACNLAKIKTLENEIKEKKQEIVDIEKNIPEEVLNAISE